MKSLATLLGLVLLATSGLACKKGTSQAGSQFNPILPPAFANQGCVVSPGVLTAVDTGAGSGLGVAIGPSSRIVGIAGEEAFYLTAGDDSLWHVDVSSGLGSAVVTQLVDAMSVSTLLANAGVTPPNTSLPEISGVGILDLSTLVVVEQTSNTLLGVSRVTSNQVSFLVGYPSESGSNTDGFGSFIRFNFTTSADVLVSGDAAIWVADPENHSIRIVVPGVLPESDTVAGLGVPFYRDGPLTVAGFDTPTGLTVTCAGELIVSETGAAGIGGHRIRLLRVGDPAFFGGFDGSAETLIGDGTAGSLDGVGPAARVDAPMGPLATADDMLYWVDSGTGLMRSCDLATLQTATLTSGMPGRGVFSTAITASGQVFVLDAETQLVYPVVP